MHVSIYVPQEMNLRIPSFSQVIGIVDYITHESEIERIVRHTLDDQDEFLVSESEEHEDYDNEYHEKETNGYDEEYLEEQDSNQDKSSFASKIAGFFKSFFD